MIDIRYIYSACVVIQTPDMSILCDPWMTEGVFYGSWYHFPPVEDPLRQIGNVDTVYISHIHQDHYDPAFLRDYFARYGQKDIYIADFKTNYLARRMKSDGFHPKIIRSETVGQTVFTIIPDPGNNIFDVDSCLIVKYFDGSRAHCVVNLNDCRFDDEFFSEIKKESESVDILLTPYTGAGPYPQTYYPPGPEARDKADQKAALFLGKYQKIVNYFNAKLNIPFAGKYLLGGNLSALNEFRGVVDPTKILTIDPKAVVLADGGEAHIDTCSLTASATRTVPYSSADISRRISEISHNPLQHETDFAPSLDVRLPILRMMSIGIARFRKAANISHDYYIALSLDSQFIVFNASHDGGDLEIKSLSDLEILTPRSVVSLEKRLLFALLSGVYHWNNAQVGSLLSIRRHPDIYVQEVEYAFSFLSV